MIRNRQPTVREIIAELRKPTDKIERCRVVRGNHFIRWAEPEEYWIESIGTWLRADGSHAGFVLNGQRDYNGVKALRLRRAVRAWKRTQ